MRSLAQTLQLLRALTRTRTSTDDTGATLTLTREAAQPSRRPGIHTAYARTSLPITSPEYDTGTNGAEPVSVDRSGQWAFSLTSSPDWLHCHLLRSTIRQRLLFKGRLTPRMGLAILRLNEHPLHLRVCRLDAALDARHGLFDF